VFYPLLYLLVFIPVTSYCIVVYTVILLYLYFTSCYVIDTLYFVTLTQDNVYT